MEKTLNIIIAGVGGQGSVLASAILGRVFLCAGCDVKVSEVHGMSQRGGSVVTYVRCGKKVFSPIIDKGEADFILAFELLEAARYAEYLSKNGRIIVNTQKIEPLPVLLGEKKYPPHLVKNMQVAKIKVDALDCLFFAQKAGNEKTVNLVLLGRLSRYFEFEKELWISTIEKTVPKKFLQANKAAFLLGRNSNENIEPFQK